MVGRPPSRLILLRAAFGESKTDRAGPRAARHLALVFTGHEFAEGATVILDALARNRASFLTGE